MRSQDWPHAGRPAHELRYSVYRDLWERGFFLSAAGKFGGDFLVYPGESGRGGASACLLALSSQPHREFCCIFFFFCLIFLSV